MRLVIIIVCIAGIIWLTISRKKVDKEEAIALKTPGTANKLRANFGEVIDLLLQDDAHQILFERSYDESIRIGNKDYQELFLSYRYGVHGPDLLVACTQGSTILKEWKFGKQTDSKSIYQEISSIFS